VPKAVQLLPPAEVALWTEGDDGAALEHPAASPTASPRRSSLSRFPLAL
jgi:hypothetical protein